MIEVFSFQNTSKNNSGRISEYRGIKNLSHFCIRRSSEGALYFPHSNTVIDIEMGQKYWCKFKSKSVIMGHIWWVMRSIMMSHIWWVILKYMCDSYDTNHKLRIIIWFKRHYLIIGLVLAWFGIDSGLRDHVWPLVGHEWSSMTIFIQFAVFYLVLIVIFKDFFAC